MRNIIIGQLAHHIWIITSIACVAVLAALAVNATAPEKGNTRIRSFNQSKKVMSRIYIGHERTLYCGCKYSGKVIDIQSCDYQIRSNSNRARRLEWEHVVPAALFGRTFKEWKDGQKRCVSKKGGQFKGRRCARKTSRSFQLMEADLYNLYPTIGEVNGLRSNFAMAILPGEPRDYGSCDVEIKDKKIEPRPKIRGDIARTYLYMNWAYPDRLNISRRTNRLFTTWDKIDPVDEWERERAEMIRKIQGNSNPFIAN